MTNILPQDLLERKPSADKFASYPSSSDTFNNFLENLDNSKGRNNSDLDEKIFEFSPPDANDKVANGIISEDAISSCSDKIKDYLTQVSYDSPHSMFYSDVMAVWRDFVWHEKCQTSNGYIAWIKKEGKISARFTRFLKVTIDRSLALVSQHKQRYYGEQERRATERQNSYIEACKFYQDKKNSQFVSTLWETLRRNSYIMKTGFVDVTSDVYWGPSKGFSDNNSCYWSDHESDLEYLVDRGVFGLRFWNRITNDAWEKNSVYHSMRNKYQVKTKSHVYVGAGRCWALPLKTRSFNKCAVVTNGYGYDCDKFAIVLSQMATEWFGTEYRTKYIEAHWDGETDGDVYLNDDALLVYPVILENERRIPRSIDLECN